MAAMIVCIMIIFCYSFKRFERENGLLSSQLKSYYKRPQNTPGNKLKRLYDCLKQVKKKLKYLIVYFTFKIIVDSISTFVKHCIS